jgi:hypothetical protein
LRNNFVRFSKPSLKAPWCLTEISLQKCKKTIKVANFDRLPTVLWVVFAVMYTIEPAIRGQLYGNLTDGEHPCIGNLNGFVDVLMFSVETQATIGYGYQLGSFRIS